jgi:hypothetical protein
MTGVPSRRKTGNVSDANVQRIMRMADAGRSSRDIVAELTRMHLPTARGGKWQSSTVARIIARQRTKPAACDHAVTNENCRHYS